jgi:hypothetical protein
MQRPRATNVNTVRIRQPHGDMTTIPSAGISGRPALRDELATGEEALPTAVGEPTPPLTVAEGELVPSFLVSYFPRAIER